MSGRGESGVERAAYLVVGAREVDEPDEGASAFCQFEKDWDAQLEQCARLAAERGYAPVGSTVVSVVQPTLPRLLEWANDPGCDILLVASARILGRLRDAWPDWDLVLEHLTAAGARVEPVPYAEPGYPGECFPQR
jgi:DNA invertase Pin-like site-specific DNA recombinase